MMHRYLLSYNPFATIPTHAQVDIFVKSHRDIVSWFLPFFGTYLFKSKKNLFELNDGFRQLFGETNFGLTAVHPSMIGGSLPPTMWHWLNMDDPSGFDALLG